MRAVLTGTGVVAPQGISNLDPLWLADGSDVPAEGYLVEGFDLKNYLSTVTSYIDRCSALGMAASKLALDDAGVPNTDARTGDWGLGYATAWGCLDSMALFFAKVAKKPKFAPPLIFSHSYANSPSSVICIEFGLCGVGATFSEGATGALTALGWARDRLERTKGSEVGGMLIAASDALSRPLRLHYAGSGRILGEAGGAVALELDEQVIARGGDFFAAVAGWGSARGDGALERAVSAALDEAGCGAEDLAGAWGGEELAALVGCPVSQVDKLAGWCGPAGSLLALDALKSAAQGYYIVAAEDPSGASVVLALERDR